MAPFLLLAGVVLAIAGIALLWGPRVAVFASGLLLIAAAVAVAAVEDRRRLAAPPT